MTELRETFWLYCGPEPLYMTEPELHDFIAEQVAFARTLEERGEIDRGTLDRIEDAKAALLRLRYPPPDGYSETASTAEWRDYVAKLEALPADTEGRARAVRNVRWHLESLEHRDAEKAAGRWPSNVIHLPVRRKKLTLDELFAKLVE